ncbi:RING-H2 finger protein ATL33 [Abeliophyllum distichum]|uniref:RING-H2 finger protein ATL33 n=1 Tax=Abeliophyllum distichum TaxID=126358 RepID=A0ABD1QZA1_9LAMI
MINTTTTTNSSAPPPFPAAQPQTSDISPRTAILCLVAVITTPFLIYTFFVAMKFPWNPFRRPSRSSDRPIGEVSCNNKEFELVCGVRKEARAKETAGSECPVCLSVFIDGEEIRQLNACKHAFHVECIDKWLYSHSNCPVCRVYVPVKRFKRASNLSGEEDFRQGLPDAANLI